MKVRVRDGEFVLQLTMTSPHKTNTFIIGGFDFCTLFMILDNSIKGSHKYAARTAVAVLTLCLLCAHQPRTAGYAFVHCVVHLCQRFLHFCM